MRSMGQGALISRTSAALREVPEATRTALATLGIDLVALGGAESAGVTVVDDVDLTYTRWLDDQDADVVLVRPDFHVYGVAGTHPGNRAGRQVSYTGCVCRNLLGRLPDSATATSTIDRKLHVQLSYRRHRFGRIIFGTIRIRCSKRALGRHSRCRPHAAHSRDLTLQ